MIHPNFSEIENHATATWRANPLLQFAYSDVQTFVQHLLIRYFDMHADDLAGAIRSLVDEHLALDEARRRFALATRPLGKSPDVRCAQRNGDRLTLWIYGPIRSSGDAGVSCDALQDVLVRNEDALAIFMRIDSAGGYNLAARGIADALMRHRARKIAVIDHTCWSSAMLIATSADRILMRADATAMMHRASCTVSGHQQDLQFRAIGLWETDQAYLHFIAKRRHVDKKSLESPWYREEFLSAQRCLQMGLIDQIVPPLAHPKLSVLNSQQVK